MKDHMNVKKNRNDTEWNKIYNAATYVYLDEYTCVCCPNEHKISVLVRDVKNLLEILRKHKIHESAVEMFAKKMETTWLTC